MRVTFFLLALNFLFLSQIISASNINRQKRTPLGYGDHYSNFFADEYSDSDLDSLENHDENKSEASEDSGSYENEEEDGESSEDDFNGRRRRRSPAGYDDVYKKFLKENYSDLKPIDHEEYRNENNDEEEEDSTEESDSSEDDFNGRRRRRSPASYDDHYNKFIAEHFSDLDDKYIDDKEEYKSASSESADDESVSEEEDEGDAKANVKDHSFAYRNNNDYERIKALSEKQVEELHKKPGNCKQFEKDGMICSECKDPETGDTSESCAYASVPNDKKVAYLSRKSHNFKTPQVEASEGESEHSEDDEDDEAEEDEEKATNAQLKSPKAANHKSEIEDAGDYSAYRLAGFNGDIDYDEPKLAHFKNQRLNKPKSEKLIELLPKSQISGNQFQSRNLNQALTDFKTKDWSNCKKVMKGELTCYYCKDAVGANQEECMYVSSTNPKNIRVERHETKNYDTNSRRPAPTVPSIVTTTIKRSAPLKIAPIVPDNKARFARLRMARPLMPTKASKIETAEPLVTPKISIESYFGDDLTNPTASSFKKTIKRTILNKKKKVTDDFIPAESRAIAFESHVKHENY